MSTLLVGIEDDGGALRAYIAGGAYPRWVVVDDPDAQEKIRRAWASTGHVLIPTPNRDQVFGGTSVDAPPRPVGASLNDPPSWGQSEARNAARG